MQTLAILLCAWLLINLLHGLLIAARRRAWEKSVTRAPDGLLSGAAAYAVGKGPVALLFIHGFADTPRIWARIAQALAASGPYTCRAMRLPGSAEPAAAARFQTLERWRAQIDDELNGLRAAHAAVWVVGHSLGAGLALDAAIRSPDKVAGVVAFAPLIKVSRRRSPLLPPSLWFLLAQITLCLSPTFESCFSAKGEAVDDPGFTYPRDRFIPFAVYSALFQLTRSLGQQAARVACPVFAVTAERDSVVDTPTALRWLRGCKGPKEIHALTEVGHVLPLEIGWKNLTDAFAAFIRNHTPAG